MSSPYPPIMEIEVYSHSYRIHHISLQASFMISSFSSKMTQVGLVRKPGGKMVNEPTKEFFGCNLSKTEYYFHINSFSILIDQLRRWQIRDDQIKIVYNKGFKPAPINFKLRDDYTLREHQVPIEAYAIEYVKDNQNIGKSRNCKFIGMQTGKGKGITSISAATKIGYRTVMFMHPKYLDKWRVEIRRYVELEDEDIIIVAGGKPLSKLIHSAKNGNDVPAFIIISSATYRNYLSEYEENDSVCISEYGCTPIEFFETIGAGTMIIDEVHEAFHMNFRICCYSNLEVIIGLSATLMNYDGFMEEMYEMAFPKLQRADKLADDRYIKVFPVSYRFYNPRPIRLNEWNQNTYSHNAFEESILRNKNILANYLKLFKFVIDHGYIKDKKPDDKLRIYATKISMCTVLRDYLRTQYPNLVIERYVGEDEYDNLINPDISISTLGSGGTGHDIPNLRAVILSVNILSIQSNRQVLGRLRKLEDRDTKFYYLYCDDFDKHREYHLKRKEALLPVCASIQDIQYPDRV